MSELLVVNFDAFHKERSQKPRNFSQFQEMVCASKKYKGKTKGIWELVQFNPKTQEVIQRLWNMNVVTDAGANAMLQRTFNSLSASPPAMFNNILMTNNSGSTTLTTALTANATAQTTLAVVALPAAIPSGTILKLGFGGANSQNVTTNGAAAQGATSITVTSFTVNSTGFIIGSNVVPVPQVTDNPSNANLTANATTPLSAYSGALTTGAFTFTPTSGAGNRTALGVYTFANATNGGAVTNGNYTDFWSVNVSSAAGAGNYLAHEVNSPMTVNDSNSVLCNITIRV